MLKVGFVCPVYKSDEFHKYTELSLRSFFETTPGGVGIVVDDGSAAWNAAYESQLRGLIAAHPTCDINFYHYPTQFGLTRSWNRGLMIAHELGLDYAIAGNNDVIFTQQWASGMLHALQHYALAGPLSNAPGVTAGGRQEIHKHIKNYTLTDDRRYLDKIASEIHSKHLGKVIDSPINGFFQMASMSAWRKGMYSAVDYYRPINNHTSRGTRNPTPTMTLNEDELQVRWRKLGLQSAVVLSSFIFHYRAVSRGDKYKRGKWFRQS